MRGWDEEREDREGRLGKGKRGGLEEKDERLGEG